MTARFALPPGSEADAPPERRGLARDAVRLLVATPDGLAHRHFHDLPDQLDAGDLLVVNTSATLPAAVEARRGDGRFLPLHVSTSLDDGSWVVEPRQPDGSGPDRSLPAGERLRLADGAHLRLEAAYPDPAAVTTRLWRATVSPPQAAAEHLSRHGQPIRYGYVSGRYPIEDYQTVYAAEPGSAEMASAGRPFTPELLVRLLAKGVTVAPIVLHAGVSSPEPHEPPLPERYDVPQATARLVNSARAAGRRVVAVGTTVVRALETVAGPYGTVRPRSGWTDLVLGPDRPARVVTGLVTGLHAPEASHLRLLEAVAGRRLVELSYQAAVAEGYLWHEFGDTMLYRTDR